LMLLLWDKEKFGNRNVTLETKVQSFSRRKMGQSVIQRKCKLNESYSD